MSATISQTTDTTHGKQVSTSSSPPLLSPDTTLTAGYHLSAESTSTRAPTPKTPVPLPASTPVPPPPASSSRDAEASAGGATGSHDPIGTASNFWAFGVGTDDWGPGAGSADEPCASLSYVGYGGGGMDERSGQRRSSATQKQRRRHLSNVTESRKHGHRGIEPASTIYFTSHASRVVLINNKGHWPAPGATDRAAQNSFSPVRL